MAESFYSYMHGCNATPATAMDENPLEKKGCQLCASEKDAKSGECKWCAKDALAKALAKDEGEFEEEKHPVKRRERRVVGVLKRVPLP